MTTLRNPPPIFDLHCHPSLKYSILKDDVFYKRHQPASGPWGFNIPLGIYYDAPGSKRGGVKVLTNAHYVPENGFRRSALLSFLQDIGVADVIEDSDQLDSLGKPEENNSAWEKLIKSIYRLENLAKETNEQLSDIEVKILTDPSKFWALRNGGDPSRYRLIMIHAIEGAHHLGRHLSDGDAQPYIDRLAQLKGWGFCVFTLSHFFLNDICDTAGGIPSSDYAVSAYQIPIAPKPGLTPIGERVVEWALKNGFLLDLVHSTPETRKGVYDINRKLKKSGVLPKLKPLAFTHTGVRNLYRLGKDATFESLSCLPDDDDIAAIRECDGILGLILMKNWLNGVDDDEPLQETLLGETIDYINDRTGGNYDHIGIGTDLDGFTHVPDNLNQCSKLKDLSDMIYHCCGPNGADKANKILYKNAERVFTKCCCQKPRRPTRRFRPAKRQNR
jgi:microsomal dipeptidase-like Zn-dependent dipeptidase